MLATQPSLEWTEVYKWKIFISDISLPTAKYGGLSIRTLLNSPDNYGNVCLHLAIKHKEASDR